MSRLRPTAREHLSTEQQEAYDRIGKERTPRADGSFGGPFDPWIRSPELAIRAIEFGRFLWERTLPRRLVEVAILVTGRFWRSNVEWVAHVRMALENGVARSTIDDIWNQRMPTGAPDDERLVYEVAKTLHERHELSNELYRRAVERFGERGLVDIIGVIGFYTMVSMTLNTFLVPAVGVEKQPFEYPESD
jgi:4-carboxymuconolactone decarboxylase